MFSFPFRFFVFFLSVYVKLGGGGRERYHLRVLHKRFERSYHGFYPQTWTLEPHYMSPKKPTVELLSLVLWGSYILIPTKLNEILLVKIVVPKRGKVTQYRANTEAWLPDDDCFRTCVNFRAHRKPNKRIRWKTVLKCLFSPPSLCLLFSFRVLLLTVSLRSYTLQVIESRCPLQQVHRLFRRFNRRKFYPKVNTQITWSS